MGGGPAPSSPGVTVVAWRHRRRLASPSSPGVTVVAWRHRRLASPSSPGVVRIVRCQIRMTLVLGAGKSSTSLPLHDPSVGPRSPHAPIETARPRAPVDRGRARCSRPVPADEHHWGWYLAEIVDLASFATRGRARRSRPVPADEHHCAWYLAEAVDRGAIDGRSRPALAPIRRSRAAQPPRMAPSWPRTRAVAPQTRCPPTGKAP